MGPRIDLHATLRNICPNVYFQPPETIKLTYPCIIYHLNKIDKIYADDGTYRLMNQYSVMYICKDPDDLTRDEIAVLPYCSFDRFYTADNLNHYVFRLYC